MKGPEGAERERENERNKAEGRERERERELMVSHRPCVGILTVGS